MTDVVLARPGSYPPMDIGPASNSYGDLTNREGAERLADMIRTTWARRGARVKTWVELANARDNRKRQMWAVRSKLVNGMPPSPPAEHFSDGVVLVDLDTAARRIVDATSLDGFGD